MKGRVLIIDDDEAMLSMITDYLETMGFFVQGFRSAVKAFEILRESQPNSTFDVVVSDINMPGLTGIDLLKTLQVLKPNLPVILISAFGGEKMKSVVQSEGAFRFLSKPFSLAELNQAVDAAVTKSA